MHQAECGEEMIDFKLFYDNRNFSYVSAAELGYGLISLAILGIRQVIPVIISLLVLSATSARFAGGKSRSSIIFLFFLNLV